MEDRKRLLWQGARPLIGIVIGVGIFGLPYVFSQVGYILGLIELIVIAALSLLSYIIFADLLEISKGHVRFGTVIGNQLGVFGRGLASAAYLAALWGSLLAYVIVGGQFLANILRPLLGGAVFNYQIAFWIIASACMIGGSLFVRRLQAVLIPVFFVMIVALTLFALPHLNFDYLTIVKPANILLPFGTLIFAFGGFSAIPEAREALGRNHGLIRSSLTLGTVLITVFYALFCLAVVGMTGPFTSVQAVDGLKLTTAGLWLPIFVSAIGVCSVFTAYVSLGNALMNSLIYDARGRYLTSWWLTVIVPLCLFLFGARDFIDVVGTTGGLLGGLLGIILLVAYERARLTAQLPKRALAIPQGLVVLSFLLFAAMIIITMLEITKPHSVPFIF